MLEQIMDLSTSREEVSCESIFTSLIEILRKELAVYRELKEAIISEKIILMKPSLGELNRANAVKENIILKVRMLEETRASILKKIIRSLRIGGNNINISQLADYASAEQRKEIGAIRSDLALISSEIKLINEANRKLLDTSLVCVKSSLDFINSLMLQGPVYMENGKIQTVRNDGKLLHMEG